MEGREDRGACNLGLVYDLKRVLGGREKPGVDAVNYERSYEDLAVWREDLWLPSNGVHSLVSCRRETFTAPKVGGSATATFFSGRSALPWLSRLRFFSGIIACK